jgi:putative two-component system response regulator
MCRPLGKWAMLQTNRNPSILVVDDTPAISRSLVRLLAEDGLYAITASGGKQALSAVAEVTPDLILLDVMMPDHDGYEVCAQLKAREALKDVPVIFITALVSANDKVKAFAVGGVDYISKPFIPAEVRARVHVHLKVRMLQQRLEMENRALEDQITEQVKEISASQMATIVALARLAESRDDDTGRHIERVQTLCRLLAERLKDEPAFGKQMNDVFITNIFHASPLHDIGKVGIRDAVLLKPGKLTAEEFDEMKTHCAIGAATLQAVQQQYPKNTFVLMGIDIARSHHERWDGRGYPDRLAAAQIPLSARITAVADVYDALRANRCYRPAFSHDQCCQMILEGKGTQFDPTIIEVFSELRERFDALHAALSG